MGVACLRCSSDKPPEQGQPGTSDGSASSRGDATTAPVTRPTKWAKPLQLPGCPNLHKVSDNLYRGAQPSAEGMKQLKKLEIKTIVNLRSLHSDRDEMGKLGFGYEHIHMKAWHAEDEDIVRFLKTVTDKANFPVFVHCQHGADRTGVTCAVYRVAVQGWSKEDALKEMTEGGYGFHRAWRNLPSYVRKLDVDEIKRRAALPEVTPTSSAAGKRD